MGHSKTTTSRPILRDWEAKRSLLVNLYGGSCFSGFVLRVAEGLFSDEGEMKAFVEKCCQTIAKWHDGVSFRVDHAIMLWEGIIRDCKLEATVARAANCSIDDFIELLDCDMYATVLGEFVDENISVVSSDIRTKIRRRNESKASAPAAMDEYVLHCSSRAKFEGPLTGLQSGRIHVHQFYCMPETVNAWAALVDSKNYRMYIDCWLSLKALTKSELWMAAVGSGRHNAAVALGGGGSPEKDRLLVVSLSRHLPQEEDVLDYVINDISLFMIHESVKRILRGPISDELSPRVRIRRLMRDFLQLDDLHRPSNWDSVVWAILGGTIGNVHEREFFRSIAQPSRVGDLLIVGLDTIGSETPDQFEARMKTQYRSKELDALLLTPLHGAVSPHEADRPLVEVSVIAGSCENVYSDVPNSWTAEFSSPPAPGRDPLVLATSTRYVLADFLEFAGRYGWEHVGTTFAPSNSTFRQLLLRRET